MIARRNSELLLGLVLAATILLVPLLDAVHGVHGAMIAAVTADAGNRTVPAGRQVEQFYLENSWVMRHLRGPWNEAMFAGFRDTPPRVVAGPGDWLFYTTSLRPFAPTAPLGGKDRILDHVRTFAEFSRRNGVQTVFLLTPEKWRLYPHELPPLVMPAERVALYERARRAVVDAGLAAPDLLAALADWQRAHPNPPLCSPGDTHLSFAGLEFVARWIAVHCAHVPESLAADRLAALPAVANFRRRGDLVGLLGFAEDGALARRFESVETIRTVPPAENRVDAEIVLLGDSTFEAYDHALPGLIQVATGSAVDARATGFDYYARVATVAASHAAHPPRWLVISVGERRLAPVEGDDW